MANLVLAFAELLGGAIIADAAIKGDSIANVVKGQATSHPVDFTGGSPATAAATGAAGAGATIAAAAGALTGAAAPAAGKSVAGYYNPFGKAAVNVERVDMGQDATVAPGSPIYSVGKAKVTGIITNWYNGQPLVETQLLDGADAGKFVYYAEGIIPHVTVGQTVAAGEQIATTTSQPTGLEFGWGANAAGQTLAQATGGYSEGQVTPAGSSFHDFLVKLGLK